MRRLRILTLSLILIAHTLIAQIPSVPQPPGDQVPTDEALDRALKKSSLTFEGKPFHAILDIGTAGTPYSGKIEVFWADAHRYKSIITSPSFSQTRIVNGLQVSETNQGDFYPRWLEDFHDALLDPVPMIANFRGRGGAAFLGPTITRSCLQRDDRPGGITDQLTWGMICFSGSDPHLSSVLTTNFSMEFSDWQGFGDKQIARTYSTDVLDYKPVLAHLTTLEELKQADDATFAIATLTPADQQISTAYVSTLKEESLVESPPIIEWPTVREGKTEGYMIVYARTDRTGQVRETEKHNSDQPGLETFGMEQALRYKFKPLLVDGVPVQMEMPLVLHFTSKLADPIPILGVDEMKKQVVSCNVRMAPPGTSEDKTLHIRVSVDEIGKSRGINPSGIHVNGSVFLHWASLLEACRFAPLVRNGVATYYKGDLDILVP